jgi:hypothetical protein
MQNPLEDAFTATQIASKHFELTGEIVTPSAVGMAARKIGAPFVEIDDIDSMYGPRKVFVDPEPILGALKKRMEANKLAGKQVNVVPVGAKTASEIVDLYRATTGRSVSTMAVVGAATTVGAERKKIPSDNGKPYNAYLNVDDILAQLDGEHVAAVAREQEADRIKADTPADWVSFRILRGLAPERLRSKLWHANIFAGAAEKLGFTPIHDHYNPEWSGAIIRQVQLDLGIKSPEAAKDLQAMLDESKNARAQAWAAEQERQSRTITPWPDDWNEDLEVDTVGAAASEGPALKCAISYNEHCRVVVIWPFNETQNSNQYVVDIEDARKHHITLVLSGDWEFNDFVRGIAKIREAAPTEDMAVRSPGQSLGIGFNAAGLWINHFEQGYCIIDDSRARFFDHDCRSRITPRSVIPIDLETVNLIGEAASFREQDDGLMLATGMHAEFTPYQGGRQWSDVAANAKRLEERFDTLRSGSHSLGRRAVWGRLVAINRLVMERGAK